MTIKRTTARHVPNGNNDGKMLNLNGYISKHHCPQCGHHMVNFPSVTEDSLTVFTHSFHQYLSNAPVTLSAVNTTEANTKKTVNFIG